MEFSFNLENDLNGIIWSEGWSFRNDLKMYDYFLIGWQELAQYGVRQLFEFLRNSEAYASYFLFIPSLFLKEKSDFEIEFD